MFNMYDDAGIKIPMRHPYETQKIQPSSPIHNRVNEKKEQDSNNQGSFDDHLSEDAKIAYKKMANIHVEEKVLHAYQIMSSTVVTVKDTDSIYSCWQLMEEHDLKQILVLASSGKIKGLATMKNIAISLIDNLHNPDYIHETVVDKITRHNIMTAEPVSDIRRVAKVMVKYHLNSIPIVNSEKDEVVGIISRADILRAVSTDCHYQLWA